MSYEHYRNLMPLPYPNAAGSDAPVCAAAGLVHLLPASSAAEPSHADQLQQLADLNSCPSDGNGAGPSAGTLLRQPAVVESRDVAAEWEDASLDADGDTKRLSRLEVGDANSPSRRRVAQQESASQSDAPNSSHTEQLRRLADLIAANNANCEDDVPLFLRQVRRA